MRSCFRKEFKKFMNSKKSGAGTEEVYKPTLWYYELLLFLKDQEMPREPVGFDIPRHEISRSQSSDDAADGENAEVEVYETIPQTPQSTISSEISESSRRSFTTKKRRTTDRNAHQTESLLALVKDKLSSTRGEDGFDIIGKNVAEKLRNLPPQMRLFAEKVINDCLFEAELGTLNRSSLVCTPQSQMRMQQNYPPSFEQPQYQLSTNMHLQEQRSNQFYGSQGPPHFQPLATYDCPSSTGAQSSQNSEVESNTAASYLSCFRGSSDNA